jgi:HTH-type transcriptional regulator/antitoxin HigA
MDIRPIRTKADHKAALKEIEALMTARAGTPEGERLDVLVTLVEAWERMDYPMDLPDPVEAIKVDTATGNLSDSLDGSPNIQSV